MTLKYDDLIFTVMCKSLRPGEKFIGNANISKKPHIYICVYILLNIWSSYIFTQKVCIIHAFI